MRIKIVLIVLVLVQLACSISTGTVIRTMHDNSKRDYHALYEHRERLLAPETDTRKAGYE